MMCGAWGGGRTEIGAGSLPPRSQVIGLITAVTEQRAPEDNKTHIYRWVFNFPEIHFFLPVFPLF